MAGRSRRERVILVVVLAVLAVGRAARISSAQPIALPKGTRIDCTAHFDKLLVKPGKAEIGNK